VRATGSQTRLTRAQRARNVSGAFAFADTNQISGSAILLVDDVHTTGATLNECAGILRGAGAASVYAATFARASDR
jgi:predicted amidophosphoribosyltransferase